jgi:hypothetical protein
MCRTELPVPSTAYIPGSSEVDGSTKRQPFLRLYCSRPPTPSPSDSTSTQKQRHQPTFSNSSKDTHIHITIRIVPRTRGPARSRRVIRIMRVFVCIRDFYRYLRRELYGENSGTSVNKSFQNGGGEEFDGRVAEGRRWGPTCDPPLATKLGTVCTLLKSFNDSDIFSVLSAAARIIFLAFSVARSELLYTVVG